MPPLELSIQKVTEDTFEDLFEQAMSAYLGCACHVCGKVFETLEDLNDVIVLGLDRTSGKSDILFACNQACFERSQSDG